MASLARMGLVAFFAVSCAAVQAATLRIYASTTGLSGGVLNSPPPEALSHSNPIAVNPATFHLYAEVTDAGTWNGISLDFSGTPGSVTMVQSTYLGLNRWNGNSDFSGQLGGGDAINLVAVQEQGLQNPDPLGQFDNFETPGGSVPTAETFYLGTAHTTGGNLVYLHVGPFGITRVGGDPNTDLIYFGWGDAPLHGNQFGASSTIYDFGYNGPEPASGILLVWGVLFVRRR